MELFFKQNTINVRHYSTKPQIILSFSSIIQNNHYFKDVLKKNSWHQPTPVQKVAIPIILASRNLITISSTGSGKTLSYILPLSILMDKSNLKTLVIVPTRQLANQISLQFNKFNQDVGCIIGGIPKSHQKKLLNSQIIVCTPGRFIDYIQNYNFKPKFQFIVLDEADRIIEVGFEQQLQKIIKNTQGMQHLYMFTATYTKRLKNMAGKYIENPVVLTIGGSHTYNKNITHYFIKVRRAQKINQLIQALDYYKNSKCLIFVNTKNQTYKIFDILKQKKMKRKISYMNGDNSQQQRQKTLQYYRKIGSNILIATDVLSRGLDITDIDVVINFDFPTNIENYTHRIGRTARYNRKGIALTFICEQPQDLMIQLIQYLLKSGVKVSQWLLQMVNYDKNRYKQIEESVIQYENIQTNVQQFSKFEQQIFKEELQELSFTKQKKQNNLLNESICNLSFSRQVMNTSFQSMLNLSLMKQNTEQKSFMIQTKNINNGLMEKQKFKLDQFKIKNVEISTKFKNKQLILKYTDFKQLSSQIIIVPITNQNLKQAFQNRKVSLKQKIQPKLKQKNYILGGTYFTNYKNTFIVDVRNKQKDYIWKIIFNQLQNNEYKSITLLPIFSYQSSKISKKQIQQQILRDIDDDLNSIKNNIEAAQHINTFIIVMDNQKKFKLFYQIFHKKLL